MSRSGQLRTQCSAAKILVALTHSITSSAMASSVGGTVRPSALAVLRLMTNSNLDDCTRPLEPVANDAGLLVLAD
jgi:hypothetical protein